MDRATVFGTVCEGSIPSRGTVNLLYSMKTARFELQNLTAKCIDCADEITGSMILGVTGISEINTKIALAAGEVALKCMVHHKAKAGWEPGDPLHNYFIISKQENVDGETRQVFMGTLKMSRNGVFGTFGIEYQPLREDYIKYVTDLLDYPPSKEQK